MSAARRAAAALAAALVLVSSGCRRSPDVPVVRTPVAIDARTYMASEAEAPAPIGADVPLDLVAKASYLVVLRLSIGRGEIDCVVRDGRTELARRRVTRLGDDLVVVPVAATGAATLSLVQPSRTGPLEIDVKEATVYRVDSSSAAATARQIAEAFEAETGRAGDPADDNLVANADFAADDEVRGTPADWYAYAGTTYDAATHTLRVAGLSPERRPFLATGPIPVEPGRHYRATWRMAVARGAVVVRAVDYDELATVFAEPPAELGAPEQGTAEFAPADGVRAVRLRFEGAAPGVDTAFDVSVVQIEALPAR